MKALFLFLIICAFPILVKAQNNKVKTVYTTDIDHFWVAYDSTQTTSDTVKQRRFIQTLYIDHGTDGLKAFMQARNYDAKLWVELINKFPKFWHSIRGNTLAVKSRVNSIEQSVRRFKTLYPEMKPAKMYFTIGGLRSGGTTTGNMVLVGTEIAAADKNTDASELGPWLTGVFKNQDAANLVALNVHEYVHTQQKHEGQTLLDQCIQEGAADFIAEQVTNIKTTTLICFTGANMSLN